MTTVNDITFLVAITCDASVTVLRSCSVNQNKNTSVKKIQINSIYTFYSSNEELLKL